MGAEKLEGKSGEIFWATRKTTPLTEARGTFLKWPNCKIPTSICVKKNFRTSSFIHNNSMVQWFVTTSVLELVFVLYNLSYIFLIVLELALKIDVDLTLLLHKNQFCKNNQTQICIYLESWLKTGVVTNIIEWIIESLKCCEWKNLCPEILLTNRDVGSSQFGHFRISPSTLTKIWFI